MLKLSQTQKNVILATTSGSVLEWYEIFIYIYWAPVLSSYFFNSDEKFTGELNALLIFAVGFLSRPLGGFIFGHIGDHFGRKVAFIISILSMSIPTIVIGLLPAYKDIGILSPLLLGLMRVIQGVPAGGELPGAICYLSECASEPNKKFMASFAFFGVGIGVMISIGEYLLFPYLLPASISSDMSWKFSFIFGGCLGVLGLYLRYKLHETPSFTKLKLEGKLLRKPVLYSLHKYKRHLVTAFFVSTSATVGFFIICVFPSLFLQSEPETEKLQMKVVLLLTLFSTATLPLYGRLGDRYPIRMLFYWSGSLILLFLPFFYVLLSQESIALLIFGELIFVGLLNMQFALLPSLLVDLFPTHIRYSGVGLSFNFCDSLIGGVTPLLAFYLTAATGNVASIVLVIAIAMAFSLGALWFMGKKAQ